MSLRLFWDTIRELCQVSVHREGVNPSSMDGVPDLRDHNSFRVGVQKKSAKILTMEAKTVKTNKRTKSGQKWLKSTKSCDYFEPL